MLPWVRLVLIGRTQHWGRAHGHVSPGLDELSLEGESGISRASCGSLGIEGRASSHQALNCPLDWPGMSSFTKLRAHWFGSSKRAGDWLVAVPAPASLTNHLAECSGTAKACGEHGTDT